MARTKRKVNPLPPVSTPAASETRIYRTCGYARLSVEDSGKPGADTIEAQKELIQNYIDAQPDMKFVKIFCDNGWTGTNFNRPAFEALMDDVRTGQIDCIVVKDLSRFGRNYLETGNYLERIFPILDVRFVAVNDHFDTHIADRSGNGYIIPLKNIINAAYSRDISRKSSSALTVKRKKGEFIGNWAAYGYHKCAGNRHCIEPDEETAPVVKDIFRWRLSGMSYKKIARRLNDMGILSPSRFLYTRGYVKSKRYADTKWCDQTVKRILSDEIYLGHMVQGRKRSDINEGKKIYHVQQSDWIIALNTHEPLIDEKTFLTVQKIAEGRRASYNERLNGRAGERSDK